MVRVPRTASCTPQRTAFSPHVKLRQKPKSSGGRKSCSAVPSRGAAAGADRVHGRLPPRCRHATTSALGERDAVPATRSSDDKEWRRGAATMSGGDHEDDERRPRGAATMRSDNDERAATTERGATGDDAERRSCFHARSKTAAARSSFWLVRAAADLCVTGFTSTPLDTPRSKAAGAPDLRSTVSCIIQFGGILYSDLPCQPAPVVLE